MAMLLLKYAAFVILCGSRTTTTDTTDSRYKTTSSVSLETDRKTQDGRNSTIATAMAGRPPHLVPTGNVQLPNHLPSPGNNIVGTIQRFPQADQDVIAAARKSPFQGSIGVAPEPRSFTNRPANTCYRNTILVLLLNSDRFMGYVRNHYVRQASKSRWAPLRSSPRSLDKSHNEPPRLSGSYTDVLLHLHDLWAVYWARRRGQKEVDDAMERFWDYLKALNVQALGRTSGWEFTEQQDAVEFLQYLVDIWRQQAGRDPLLAFEVRGFDSMIECVSCPMKRCSLCRDSNNVKSRRLNEIHDFWLVPLDLRDVRRPLTGNNVLSTPLNLDDILHRLVLKEISDAWHCDDCRRAWELKEELASNGSQEIFDARRKAKAAELTRPQLSDFVWRKYGRLPETLFMQINAFDENTARKTKVKLNIPEEIDLAQYVEEAVFEGSTRYRLRGVVCHRGQSAKSGHYICYVRHEEQWWLIDDFPDRSQVPFSLINNHSRGFTPFLLLWEKIPGAKTVDENSIKEVASTKETTAPAPKAGTRAGSKTPPPPKTQPAATFHQHATTAPQRPPEVPRTSGQISGTYIIDGRRISYCLDIPYIADIVPRTYAPDKKAAPSSKLKRVTFEHEGHVRLHPDADGHKSMKHPIANALLTGSVDAIDDVKTSQVQYEAWFNWYNDIPDAKSGVYHPITRESKEMWEKRIAAEAAEAAQAAKDAEPRRRAAEAAINRNAQNNPPKPKSPVTVIQPVPSGKKKTKTKDAGTDPKTPPPLEKSKIQGVALSLRSPKPAERASSSSSSSGLSAPPRSPSIHQQSPAPERPAQPKTRRAAKPPAQPTRTYLPRAAKTAAPKEQAELPTSEKRKRPNNDDDDDSEDGAKPKGKVQKTKATGKDKGTDEEGKQDRKSR